MLKTSFSLMICLAVMLPVHSFTAVVTNGSDSGPGSLRATISAAVPGDTITFAQPLAGQTIFLTGGPLHISKSLTIDASAISGISIDGNAGTRIFEVSGSATNTLFSALTLSNGAAAGGTGGAIHIQSGAGLTVSNCTLTGNTADMDGGGIDNSGSLTLLQCTLAGNSAGNRGGGIDNSGTLVLEHCTLADNSAPQGGGIYNHPGGLLHSTNSIIAGNSAALDDNISGSYSGSYNLTDIEPLLGSLGDYGGPTQTMPPLPGSPAIDAGTPTSLPVDQRGYPRTIIGESAWANNFSGGLNGANVLIDGSDPMTGTIHSNSFLLTAETTWQKSSLVLPDPGPFAGFEASFEFRYTDPDDTIHDPADGISFSFGPAPAAAVGENGITAGHVVSFNIYNLNHASQGAIRYFRTTATPTNALSSTPFGRFTDANQWHTIEVVLSPAGLLNVWFNGTNVLNDIATTYTHAPGDTFTFGGRTAAGYSEQRIDQVRIDLLRPDIGAVEWDRSIPIIVTTAADESNGTTNGISLREAIAFSTNAPETTILFNGALNGETITLIDGELAAAHSLAIDATSLPGGIVIDGNGSVTDHRIFSLSGASTFVTFNGLTLINGAATGSALNDRDKGGGIYLSNGASLVISNSTIAGSTADYGGGVYNRNSALTVHQCTLSENSATMDGGGIYNANSILTLHQCTLSGNAADSDGGGIININGTLNCTNSIIAGNYSDAHNNIKGVLSSCINSITNGNPLLAPLGDYGGSTPTIPPLPGSPAVDAGGTTLLTNDQRRRPRMAGPLDIGAVEIQSVNDTDAIFTTAWTIDSDGDDSPFGAEYALGTDWHVADRANSTNLTAHLSGGAVFGFNPAATNRTAWILTRSVDLTSDPFVEIYRYDGPTGMTSTNIPLSVNMTAAALEVLDLSVGTNAYYRFIAEHVD